MARALSSSNWADKLMLQPLRHLFLSLDKHDQSVLYVLLTVALALGFLLGRRRPDKDRVYRIFGAWRSPTFQNDGEAQVSQELCSHFGPPHYHLMNHVTLRVGDETTQIDHVLLSRFGVFVIETKAFNGWIFGTAADPVWTHVYFRRKFRVQNPLFQNYRHVRAVQSLLDFLPAEAVKSVVVFSGSAEFKTGIPTGVLALDEVASYIRNQTQEVMSLNRLQFCVGRLETARLAISRETDVEHVQNLARRFGRRAV